MPEEIKRKSGRGGRRPGAGRPRKVKPVDPFVAAIDSFGELNLDLLDQFMEERFKPEPLPPPMTRAEKKARTAELNNTIRQLRKFGWRVPDDDKDF